MPSHILDLTLPLADPILKNLLILGIILFSPIILNKLRIPNLLGLILAGAFIGPHGFHLIERDSSIIVSGTTGLLYIMFLAGLEIDLVDFYRNKSKGVVFGLYTFLAPMILVFVTVYYGFGLSISASILIASMLASHTLITYPLASKLGAAKNRVVNITVGGTMITDVLSLLTLAVIVDLFVGESNGTFWIRFSVSAILFGVIVLYIFPIIARWFFKRFDDNILQYIFVLLIVFISSMLAGLSGMEPIIGAFFAGLALNRLIPKTSPLMNRVEFVGNAVFIPYFLIGVGMLIDYSAFFAGVETIKMGVVLTLVGTFSKYISAWLTQKTFKFSADERSLIFGLSNARVAVTLATALVGYNIILGKTPQGEDIRLLNEDVLNGTILMILFTSTISSFATQRAAKRIAVKENEEVESDEQQTEKVLIPVSNIETIDELVNLGVTVKSKNGEVFALNVISSDVSDAVAEKKGKKILNQAAVTAAATDHILRPLLRYDINIVNGVTGVVKEHKISDLILGLHKRGWISDSFLGYLTEGILTKCNTTTLIYKAVQPLSTVKRHIVVVPHFAEKEIGFSLWVKKVWNLSTNSGAKIIFYTTEQTMEAIEQCNLKQPVEYAFEELEKWNEFPSLAKTLEKNDNLILVLSRENEPSFHPVMKKIPNYLNRYFRQNSFILVYPMQEGVADHSDTDFQNPAIFSSLERLSDFGKNITNIWKKTKK